MTLLSIGLALLLGLGQPPKANPIGTAVLGFKERVADYVKIHHEAESKVPKLTETNDPTKVHDREVALGVMIKTLRPTAKEGDVLGGPFRRVLEDEVRKDFRQRSALDRKALIQELPANLKLAVNMTYPTNLPLATFPARLLQKLPNLPEQLEYRIVGRHLVLRDVTANVIVDIARDIVPTIPS
jgi:hypothetical protein